MEDADGQVPRAQGTVLRTDRPGAHFLEPRGSVHEPIHCTHASACLPPL